VDILSCKRIGRQYQDKPRSLLVYVRSREQAQAVISSAKLLRKSSNATVRTCVFVNPNLTKAEAKAQYELRQRRWRTNDDERQGIVQTQSRVPDAAEDHTMIPSLSDMLYPRPNSNKPLLCCCSLILRVEPDESC
jgi:hypothetical protein